MIGNSFNTNETILNLQNAAGCLSGLKRKIPPHLAAVLMLGIVSQVGQVVLLREFLMVFHGNELSIGLILAAWMVWVGTGSRLGALLVERLNRSLFFLLINTALVYLLLPATIIIIRLLRGFFDLPPGAFLSVSDMLISCLLLMAPFCLLVGAQFVLLARAWRELDQSGDTSGAGKTYVGEAAGNMLGGIIFTFILVRYLNSFQVAILVSFFMFGAAFYTIKKTAAGYHQRVGLGVLMIAAAIMTIFSYFFLDELDRWTYRKQWYFFSPQHELVETHQSKHGNIAVMKLGEQYSFFQSGHLIFSTAGPEALMPGLEEQEAVEFAHLVMVQHQNPEQILLIGGGLRGVLGEIIKHPVARVDYIELDEVLTRAARPYVSAATLEALNNPRVNLIHADGRLFVKEAVEKYDMIIVDAPDPATAVLNRFYTLEFFREAEKLLKPGGVVAIGAVSTPDLRGTEIANRNSTIYHTLRSVFKQVLPVGERVMLFFATNSPEQVSADPAILHARYLERDISAVGFSAYHYYTLLEETQLRRVNWMVRNHGRSSAAHLLGPQAAPLFPPSLSEQELAEDQLPPVNESYFINTDFKPIGYLYTLMFWDQLTRGGNGVSFKWLLHIQPWWVLPFVILPLLAALVMRFTAGRRAGRELHGYAVLFTAFTTGFSTMALQIALLFSFQSVYGFIYETVGLIIALFMGGLALGAYLTHRFIHHKTNINALAAVQLLTALLAILIATVLPRAAAMPDPSMIFFFFAALTVIAGLVNGVIFPLSLARYMALSGRADRAAGTVYGLELFGACAGAALSSAVIVPVLGIIASCILAAVANGAAFVILLIARGVDPCLSRSKKRIQ